MASTDPIQKLKSLSKRQVEVLRLFCSGTPYKEIGAKLFISENTVKTHMGNIYVALELTHLPPRQRPARIFEIYCPLLKKQPPVSQAEEKDEEPEPVSPEVQKMVEEDENALVLWESSQIIDGQVEEIPPRPRRNAGCLWGLGGIIVGLGLMAGAFFLFRNGIPGISGQDSLPTQSIAAEEVESSPVPITDTAEMIVLTATSVPISETPLPSDTPIIPTTTTVPSETPEPDTAPGSILEVGEWWKEDGVWLRLANYSLTENIPGIRVTLELWNKTGGTLLFSWNTSGNLSLQDNNGFNYPLTAQFTNLSDSEKFDPGALDTVRPRNQGITAFYEDDRLFDADVTELILTVIDLSRVDQAQFRIPLNK